MYLRSADLSVIRRSEDTFEDYYSSEDDFEDNEAIDQGSQRVRRQILTTTTTTTTTSTTNQPTTTTSTTTRTPSQLFFASTPAIPIPYGKWKILLGAIGIGLLMPGRTRNILPGEAPPGQPQPGTFGGGDPPSSGTETARRALALLPLTMAPVSVFPPWVRQRQFPAVAVVWTESGSEGRGPIGIPHRLRRATHVRSLKARYALRHPHEPQRTTGLRKLGRKVIRLYQQTRRVALCKRQNMVRFLKRVIFGGSSYEDPICQIREPLYGFRVQVELVNERCTLNVTCTADGERLLPNADLSGYVQSRQTGESFMTSGPVLCRTVQC